MIEDRIGELRLRVRTDLPEAELVAARAEDMARLALERCAALLEERSPGRVVRVRNLPLRWRLDEAAFEDPASVEELAQAAAEAVERIAVPVSSRRLPIEAEAVWFADEAQFWAARLLAEARRQSAWFFADAEDGGALAALAAPARREIALGALQCLAEACVLGEALTGQPDAAVAVLAAALGLTGPAEPARVAAREPELTALTAAMADWPAGFTGAAWALGLRVQAAAVLGVAPDHPAAAGLAAAGRAATGSRDNSHNSAATASSAISSMADRDRAASGVRGEDGSIAPGFSEPSDFREAADTDDVAALRETLSTRCAGLFYLLDRIQELELAEALWKACLPEGAVLAVAAAALLGPEFADDPVITVFGGVDTFVRCPEIAPEQHAEIAAATCAALAAALPRRGLADLPPIALRLVEHAAGRLLVAAAEESPFGFFAWPAATAESLQSGLRVLLDTWPPHGPITAAPALGGLDRSFRVQPRRALPSMPLLLPEFPSAPAAALIAVVAGAPSLLFAARAGSAPSSAEAFAKAHLARPGRIRIGDDEITVILAADDIDLAVRRAGLDRDPGWLPWLQRSVRFVFEG